MRHPVFGYGMATVREVLDLYAQGLTYPQIVNDIVARRGDGPCRQTIGVWVKASGVPAPRQMEKLRLDNARNEVRRLVLEESYSINAAAIRCGVSYTTARSAVPRNEVLSRGEAVSNYRQRWHPLAAVYATKREVTMMMRKRGATYDEIIAATGLARSSVIKYLREAGMTKQIARRRAA